MKATRHSSMVTCEEFVDWGSTVAAVLTAMAVIYMLAAPWFVIQSCTNRTPLPPICNPVVYILESDFRGPMLWYMKGVWGTEFLYIGTDSEKTPMYATVAWVLAGAVLIGFIAFPWVKRYRRYRTR